MKPDISLLETEITFKTSRSGGSGGQHVNKVSTKVVRHPQLAFSYGRAKGIHR